MGNEPAVLPLPLEADRPGSALPVRVTRALAATLIVLYGPTISLLGLLLVPSSHGGVLDRLAWIGWPPYLILGSALWALGVWFLAHQMVGFSWRAAIGFWILGLFLSFVGFLWWTVNYTN